MTEDVNALSAAEIARRTGRSRQAVKRLLDTGLLRGTILAAPKWTKFRKAEPKLGRRTKLAAVLLVTAREISGPMYWAALKALELHHPDLASKVGPANPRSAR